LVKQKLELHKNNKNFYLHSQTEPGNDGTAGTGIISFTVINLSAKFIRNKENLKK